MIYLPPPPVIERPAIIQQVGRDIAPDLGIAFAPGFRKPANVPTTLAFQGATNYPSSNQTVTFTGVSIGAAAANRYVFITIPYYNGTSSNYSIASVTIGGISATIHAQPFLNAGADRGGTALVSALVPTGTTATVVVTWAASGAGYYRPRIAVYRVTGLQSTTPFHLITDTDNAGTHIPRTFTVNTTKGGFVLLGCAVYGNSTSRTMSGLPTDFSAAAYASMQHIGGSNTISASGTLSATISGGTSAYWSVVMACFR
ncbi:MULTISPECIES: hypothetical protein [unclassified Mesorhizobium]|uniref:hypothetical protein n=1 Tax=unclassified Mesorhizobium TaxID=325217 RepID=UPI000FDA3DBD|nr:MULTISPECIES: hypothetical protein [unclassified Mesorhizobium]TGT76158.1 hypothetical protein EN809_000595 [Mesorhizobium sp. M2E.F.Ca.ET.166.01.1.1]TGW02273.1 hypothetical protein EN797_000595 [Mesorhizobium sp. M2E.F.Ca.ET.154.01.1.1]